MTFHFPEELANDCFYRVVIKAFHVRDGKLMMTEDHTNPKVGPTWELPGGGLDYHERPREGLTREVQEEMGLTITDIDPHPVYTWSARREGRHGIDLFYSFVVGFRVEFSSLDFTPSDECKAIKFFSKEELTTIQLNDQMIPLLDYFNPIDFT